MADRFYLNRPLAIGEVQLDGAEAHHLAAVRRFRPGDRVYLFNGDGHEYPARVVSIDRRQVTVEVTAMETPQREADRSIEIAAAMPKGDRADFLIEKLTELGVARFVPLSTRRAVVHPRDTKLDRLRRTVIEASKQCGRNVLMEIAPLTEWADYLRSPELPNGRWIAHPGVDSDSLGSIDLSGVERLALAVGPEGGFTEEEVSAALGTGWRRLHLGPRILRVETAALLLAGWAGQGKR